ncbi:Myb-like DNA-binding domain containing protein [Trichomonas vaginalis G3]|uniref:Myb-like DNA-binding domain containing protein n=1 Tax=Trichomonas vaginalis (strain ATCC PRA-98 / G3) TaxID=412133 RepID=A2DC23_TRIV3|nr:RNA polymerase II transcription regulator recruiting protein [Trichomonas vaginalis G3]EAY22064.1 Myb-like DNA-binding domain containing protein [Trichomonas vaginalis G3]KAI5525307.1 RNA polymerase II transcription regulator recruiting protein [Trichomonas vaginalis G3]|eukprot:XP_001583050.1 Myb-like DNA-binding domain containing protein [Trichomonas vaginalis G3]
MSNSPTSHLGMSEILDYGSSLIKSAAHGSHASISKSYLLSVMKNYLSNKISYQEASDIFLQKFGSAHPIEKLQEIVNESLILTPIPAPEDDYMQPKQIRYWSQRENTRLMAGVFLYGSFDWSKIAAFVGGGRGRPQCLQRWTRTLNPSIVKDIWTPEEDKKLLSIVQQSDKVSWTRVANFMGNRSDVQCRYHYSQLMKNKTSKISSPSPITADYNVMPNKPPQSPLAFYNPQQSFVMPTYEPKRTVPAYVPTVNYANVAPTANYPVQVVMDPSPLTVENRSPMAVEAFLSCFQ